MGANDSFSKKKFRNEYHKLLVNIQYTSRDLLARFQEHLEKYNITPQQFNILKILQSVSPNSLSMTEVKEHMIDKNSDLTRLVDRLIEKKLVIREADTENRRKINLRITDQTNMLITEIDQQIQCFEKELHHLSEKQVTKLNKLLIKVREKLA